MDAIETLMTRRSIRHYTGDPVSEEVAGTLLRAAMAAPSAGNAQPWLFIVIRERALLDRIPAIHPYARMAGEAPLAVVVCADPAREKYPGFWVQDVSAATENLLLAAHAEGLGAVWCGIYPLVERMTAFRDLLEIPDPIVPFALVPVGVPNESKEAADRYDPARVHRDRWSLD